MSFWDGKQLENNRRVIWIWERESSESIENGKRDDVVFALFSFFPTEYWLFRAQLLLLLYSAAPRARSGKEEDEEEEDEGGGGGGAHGAVAEDGSRDALCQGECARDAESREGKGDTKALIRMAEEPSFGFSKMDKKKKEFGKRGETPFTSTCWFEGNQRRRF